MPMSTRSASFPRGAGTGTAAVRGHSPTTPVHAVGTDYNLEDPLQREQLLEELDSLHGNRTVLWTLPWHLAVDAQIAGHPGSAQTPTKWPDGAFEFFLAAVTNPSIMDADGAHSFLDVLYQYRDRLDISQKEALQESLRPDFWSNSPTFCHSLYRLREYLIQGPQEAITFFQDTSDLALQGRPVKIEVPLGLFKTFEVVGSANVVGTLCKASTELHEDLEFTISLPHARLKKYLAGIRPQSIRADLFTSRIARESSASLVLDRLKEAMEILDAYDDQRRIDTLTTLPAALAATQANRPQWSSRIFDALLDDVSQSMQEHGVDPQIQFLSIFTVLKDIKGLTREQKQQTLVWIKQNIGDCRDEATQKALAAFIVDRFGEVDIEHLTDVLKNSYRATEGAQMSGVPDIPQRRDGEPRDPARESWELGSYHQNYRQCASAVAAAIDARIQERADQKAQQDSHPPTPRRNRLRGALQSAAGAVRSAASAAGDAATLAAARAAVSVSPSSMRRSESGTPSVRGSAERYATLSPAESLSPVPPGGPARWSRSASISQEPLRVRVRRPDGEGKKED